MSEDEGNRKEPRGKQRKSGGDGVPFGFWPLIIMAIVALANSYAGSGGGLW